MTANEIKQCIAGGCDDSSKIYVVDTRTGEIMPLNGIGLDENPGSHSGFATLNPPDQAGIILVDAYNDDCPALSFHEGLNRFKRLAPWTTMKVSLLQYELSRLPGDTQIFVVNYTDDHMMKVSAVRVLPTDNQLVRRLCSRAPVVVIEIGG